MPFWVFRECWERICQTFFVRRHIWKFPVTFFPDRNGVRDSSQGATERRQTEMDDTSKKDLSRRNALKTIAGGLVGASIVGLSESVF